jgi:hypothetical protein
MASYGTQEPITSFQPDKFFFSQPLGILVGLVLDDSSQLTSKPLIAGHGVVPNKLAQLQCRL